MKSKMKDVTKCFKSQLDLLYDDHKLWWMIKASTSDCSYNISMRYFYLDDHENRVILFPEDYEFSHMHQNVPVFNLIEKEK